MPTSRHPRERRVCVRVHQRHHLSRLRDDHPLPRGRVTVITRRGCPLPRYRSHLVIILDCTERSLRRCVARDRLHLGVPFSRRSASSLRLPSNDLQSFSRERERECYVVKDRGSRVLGLRKESLRFRFRVSAECFVVVDTRASQVYQSLMALMFSLQTRQSPGDLSQIPSRATSLRQLSTSLRLATASGSSPCDRSR